MVLKFLTSFNAIEPKITALIKSPAATESENVSESDPDVSVWLLEFSIETVQFAILIAGLDIKEKPGNRLTNTGELLALTDKSKLDATLELISHDV